MAPVHGRIGATCTTTHRHGSAGSSQSKKALVATDTKLIVNLTRGVSLCEGAIADRPVPRMKGLLGRAFLPSGEGVLLRPAPSIHTAFMRFPIDALFLDDGMKVLAIEPSLPPWRVAGHRGARSVLELAAGECDRLDVRIGDRLALRDVAAAPSGESWTVYADGKATAPEQLSALTLHILVVSADRRFRGVASVLLSGRGCSVTTCESTIGLHKLARRVEPDVVVLDLGARPALGAVLARVRRLHRAGRLIVVAEDPPRRRLAWHDAVLPKWGRFEELYAAVEGAALGRENGHGRP
jgi:uncharacterized membrane protein (UPF0127 family)